ncbi:uncharacterized protein LOC128990761 [Macrosteles quadrilineatus]|uniref:uncharacterized protein LOC128990761 n=1 Tax=Macrosteles quadrilineatus TaxID=74068 RepID=UPI0023E128B1|nr:uncharacterized protein LOC128990761 [Macrosteles quadrilineatus]
MKIHYLVVISACFLSISSSCNVASFGYSSSYYDDYNTGPQVGFGFGPGFFGYTGGFGLGSLGLLLAMLMSRNHHPSPRVVHHHHHHYYKEKPGGGFDYQYKNGGPKEGQSSYGQEGQKWGQSSYGHEGPKWGQSSYGPGGPTDPGARGPKSDGPFSNFFKNMFHRR